MADEIDTASRRIAVTPDIDWILLARERIEALENALLDLLAEPYGCSLCDSGKPRNEVKGHQPDCPYEAARAAISPKPEPPE